MYITELKKLQKDEKVWIAIDGKAVECSFQFITNNLTHELLAFKILYDPADLTYFIETKDSKCVMFNKKNLLDSIEKILNERLIKINYEKKRLETELQKLTK